MRSENRIVKLWQTNVSITILYERSRQLPCGRKRKRHKIATHKRKKKLRANRHKKKLR